MNNEAFQKIIQALETNSTSVSLSIADETLTPTQFQQFCVSLATNTSLIILRLHNLHLNQNDSLIFAETLKINKHLSSLLLTNTPLNEHSLRPLTEALTHNESLTSLSILDCQLNDACIHLFAQMIEKNNTLETLDLNLNPITEASDEVLAQSLRFNTNITALKLDSVCLKTHQQLSYNQKLYNLLNDHYFPNISLRNDIHHCLQQKFASSHSFIGQVMQKNMRVSEPSLRDIAHHEVAQATHHGKCDRFKLRTVLPEELLTPLHSAALHRSLGIHAMTKLRLFNPITQALQRQQQGQSTSAEETFTFKVLRK